jgi:hypothetical protein
MTRRAAGSPPARANQRRARVILNRDEIFTKVHGYVLGNLLTSVIAGIGGCGGRPVSGSPPGRGARPPAVWMRGGR